MGRRAILDHGEFWIFILVYFREKSLDWAQYVQASTLMVEVFSEKHIDSSNNQKQSRREEKTLRES